MLAILLCDQIIVEQGTNKKSLIGLFDRLHTQEVPATRRLGFFARLTDLEGTYNFEIRVVYLGHEEESVGTVKISDFQIQDRLGMVDIALNLPPVPFPRFGRYEFQLFADDVYLGRAVVETVQAQG